MKTEIRNGDFVKDSITGFEGVVTAVCKYYNGNTRIQIQAKELVEGMIVEEVWIDACRLTVMAGCEEYFRENK